MVDWREVDTLTKVHFICHEVEEVFWTLKQFLGQPISLCHEVCETWLSSSFDRLSDPIHSYQSCWWLWYSFDSIEVSWQLLSQRHHIPLVSSEHGQLFFSIQILNTFTSIMYHLSKKVMIILYNNFSHSACDYDHQYDHVLLWDRGSVNVVSHL